VLVISACVKRYLVVSCIIPTVRQCRSLCTDTSGALAKFVVMSLDPVGGLGCPRAASSLLTYFPGEVSSKGVHAFKRLLGGQRDWWRDNADHSMAVIEIFILNDGRSISLFKWAPDEGRRVAAVHLDPGGGASHRLKWYSAAEESQPQCGFERPHEKFLQLRSLEHERRYAAEAGNLTTLSAAEPSRAKAKAKLILFAAATRAGSGAVAYRPVIPFLAWPSRAPMMRSE